MNFAQPIDPSRRDQYGYILPGPPALPSIGGHVHGGAAASPPYLLPPHDLPAPTPPPRPSMNLGANHLQLPLEMQNQGRCTYGTIGGECRPVRNFGNPLQEEMPMQLSATTDLLQGDLNEGSLGDLACVGMAPPGGDASFQMPRQVVEQQTLPLCTGYAHPVTGAPLNPPVGTEEGGSPFLGERLILGAPLPIYDFQSVSDLYLSDPDGSDGDEVGDGSNVWLVPPVATPIVRKKTKESYKRCNWCGNDTLRDKTRHSCAAAPCGKWVCGRCQNRYFVQGGFYCCKCVRNPSCACHTCKRVNQTKLSGSG